MNKGHYKYLFGPVPSRRFGRSLGVDLTPYKTCSFDCIFCQLGRTTKKTVERREYVPIKKVIAELDEWLATGEVADYITLSGSGEPTLHSGFGQIIDHIHNKTTVPAVLLTNGSLLGVPAVREQAARADIVKVSFSAFDQSSFEHINRPHPEILFEQFFEGLQLFRRQFTSKLWIEVFLIWGTNTVKEDVKKIAALIQKINPDKIQLNTAVRPPCENYAYPVPGEQMQRLAGLFDPPAEVIAEFSSDTTAVTKANEEALLDLLMRRPCSLNQLCEIFNLHKNEASKYLGKLERNGLITEKRGDNEIYFYGVHERKNETTKKTKGNTA